MTTTERKRLKSTGKAPGEVSEPAFRVERLGIIARPTPGNPREAWGIFNPGAARGRDGQLYLFPRVVAEGNFSRIAFARVQYDAAGRPTGIERLGIALEPTEPYERNPKSGGGCEDARVTYLRPLDCYVMTYTAYTLLGPRIALALSKDLFSWQRLGLLRFASTCHVDFNAYGDKDGLFFPDAVPDEQGRPSLALIHRPTYHVAQAEGTVMMVVPPGLSERRQSLWLAYIPLEPALRDPSLLTWVADTRLLATPQQPWESIKLGGGTPPVLTPDGWLVLYHGVSGQFVEGDFLQFGLRYSAGALLLDPMNPLKVLYRSRQPLLTPLLAEEEPAMVPHVVFPTGIDQHPDATDPDSYDVYYGVADRSIGVARLHHETAKARTPARRLEKTPARAWLSSAHQV